MMGRNDILAVLRDIKQNFAEKYGILEIGIFGSTARDEAREDSDVDICIKTKTPDPFAIVHIKEEIESRVRKHVDIVRIREKMNPFLRERIEKEGIYV
ncbi:MAG: nucleotidyltransferase domain-containing protein [Deltaproteobacteria bacterium]